jgi:hypothetical protein
LGDGLVVFFKKPEISGKKRTAIAPPYFPLYAGEVWLPKENTRESRILLLKNPKN